MTTTPQANVPVDPRSADAATLGAEGNERLTAWAGAALFVGFGSECLTLLDVRWWLTAHMLIGISLLVPTAVKCASTIYRFVRYYTNSPAYVRKGPPKLLLRVIGPFLLLNTVGVLLTGVSIPFAGSYRWRIEQLHELGTWTWAALIAVHVLYYVWRVPQLMLSDLAGRGTFRSAAFQRIAVVAGSGLVGMILALALVGWVRGWITHN